MRTRSDDTLKTDLLLAALPDVPFDGWTAETLSRAAKKTGTTPAALQAAFPAGTVDMALYFSTWADAELLKKMTPARLSKMRIRDQITFAVRTRLEIIAPFREATSSALKLLARPPHNLRLVKMVWATADVIWRAAGDTATDYNRYTKRLLLSGVLTSTTLRWMNDTSAGHEKTWRFLDQRIDNVMKIGQKLSRFKKKA